MLGCHDFCGYYEWTFHHLRRSYGPSAVHSYWSDAIGGESQQAYADAARRSGLRGLLEVWTKSGDDESCDWTFALDEQRNALRWDMRRCPSKGFLIDNNLNADEDYCNHCMGWIVPLLDGVGIEIAGHEHNHRGQCWGEMRAKGVPHVPLDVRDDIRNDPRWRAGYVHAFVRGEPIGKDVCRILLDWFADCTAVHVGRELLTGRHWLPERHSPSPCAVILDEDAQLLAEVATGYLSVPAEQHPLLLHAYFPGSNGVDFTSAGLPRPLPLLPVLIRAGVYHHEPATPSPTTAEQALLLEQALIRLRKLDQGLEP